MYVFHYYFFLSALSSVRCSGVGGGGGGGGGKLLRSGYLHPLGEGGKLPSVRGIPRGTFTPEGRQTAQRQLHSPCGEGGGGGEGQATQDSR